MRKQKRTIALLALFALTLTGCGISSEQQKEIPFSYTGSKSFEYYDVGNDRNADFLSGKATEVCIPSLVPEEVITDDSMDYYCGLYRINDRTVLEEYRVLEKIYPASTTKLLTALIALKKCNLSEQVTFSYNASHIDVYGATLCGFEEGDNVMLGDLLAAFLICSGNDAGIAIAEHVSGSVEAFATLMNEEAEKMGAVDTHFVNPHGMHNKEHYTTPYDIYLFFNELIHYNAFLSIISMPVCEVEYTDAEGNQKTKTFESTNQFLVGDIEVPEGIEVIGGKTGTTYAAGCCLTLYFKDAEGNAYIAEVFHMPDYKTLYQKMSELIKQVSES